MDQGMTTSTNAEETREQRFNEALTQTTSGPAAPWQILATSNIAFVALPDTRTVPHNPRWSGIFAIQPLAAVQLPTLDQKPKERQMSHYLVDDPLRRALLRLLAYSPEPDEPGAEDIGPAFGYESPR